MYRAFSRSLRKLRRLLNNHEVEIENELSYFPKILHPCPSTLHVFQHLHDNCILKPYFAVHPPVAYETPRATELTIKSVQDGLALCFQLMRQINYRIHLLEDEDYHKKTRTDKAPRRSNISAQKVPILGGHSWIRRNMSTVFDVDEK